MTSADATGKHALWNFILDLLYKYRPFDAERQTEYKRTLENLREAKLWMAKPSSFNDPFDCQASILRNIETEQRNLAMIIENYVAQISKALRTDLTLADRACRPVAPRTLVNLKRLLKSREPNHKKYRELKTIFVVPTMKHFSESSQARLARVGVLSLSANPTEMQMWTHYASQHRGVCLGFERSEGSLLKNHTHTKPVNYLNEYPQLSLDTLEGTWSVSMQGGSISDSMAIHIEEPHLQAVIYSKSTNWNREQEWRVLVPKGEVLSGYAGPLRTAIFGLRCGQGSRRLVEEAVKEAPHEGTIRFAEIQSSAGSFDLRNRDLG